ncbi:MAG: HAD family hydrolase [Parvibaculum sp.]
MKIPQTVLFLDRDGVINVDKGYVNRQQDFEFVSGIFELVRIARSNGFGVIVVTNQSGIGRGYYSEADFQRLTTWMLAEFIDQQAPIDHVYHCPFHPEATLPEFRQNHPWRKPSPGMLLAAVEQFDTNLANSVFVGDKRTDVQAGIAAGIGTMLHLDPQADKHAKTDATAVISNLAEAQQWLRSPIE